MTQLRKHRDYRVHVAVLSTLRNLSYGRTNVENKLMIASDSGLPEMTLLLKTTPQPEVCTCMERREIMYVCMYMYMCVCVCVCVSIYYIFTG